MVCVPGAAVTCRTLSFLRGSRRRPTPTASGRSRHRRPTTATAAAAAVDAVDAQRDQTITTQAQREQQTGNE